jgi:TBC1 domain family member 2
VTSPPRLSYTARAPQSSSAWGAEDEDEEDEDEGDFTYDDDEDEFGLPSLASIRKKKSTKARINRTKDPGAGTSATNGSSTINIASRTDFMRSDSYDIAEERNPLAYPSTKKGDGKILRPQYKEILKDPANSLHLISHPTLPPNSSPKEIEAHSTRVSRINKFKRILQTSSISLAELRTLAWSGVPEEVRAMTWQLLLGYLPTNSERRVAALERKRKEYLDGVRQAFSQGTSANQKSATSGLAGLASNPPITTGKGRGLDEAVWHQISIDVPRTNPHIPLYQFEATQRSLERILYVWAIRHPASGYVQGINDLATPFWQVFLGTYITDLNIEEGMDPGQLPKPVLDAVEADSFWCLTKLLDGIQDNYIYAQPGIHRQVSQLRDLTARIDAGLAKHFESEGVEYMQFSFRWVNCLLMREISIKNTIRMWDTYFVSLILCSLNGHCKSSDRVSW